jgi:hypothetical protein
VTCDDWVVSESCGGIRNNGRLIKSDEDEDYLTDSRW